MKLLKSIKFQTLWIKKFGRNKKCLDNSEKINKEFSIKNTNRAVGTRLSHQHTKYGYERLNKIFNFEFQGISRSIL